MIAGIEQDVKGWTSGLVSDSLFSQSLAFHRVNDCVEDGGRDNYQGFHQRRYFAGKQKFKLDLR